MKLQKSTMEPLPCRCEFIRTQVLMFGSAVRINYSAYPYASPMRVNIQIVPDDLVAPT